MKQFKFNERQRFSIRKFSMGAASVLLGSVFFAVSSVEDVQAAEQSQNVVGVNENKQTPDPVILSNSSTTGVSTEETNTSVSATNVENKPEGDVVGSSKETLNKTALTKLIEDIDGKFTNGKYASKTEDSVNQLKTALDEAKSVLNNAKIQEELTRAYNKLVTVTTQLKTKPEEKKEAPAVDTTNGKATVGIKATNTEKVTETNSIAHSGSRDERNGKALNTNNPFRTDATTTNDDPSANQTYIAPAENADFATLTNKLKTLPNYIENNKKVQDMNTLGDEKGVTAGRVAEITEFGGWKAVSQEDGSAGKFAIARKTEKGVFPIETVNVVGPSKTAWLEEQSFNRDRNYMLFLSEVRTQATQNKESYNSQPYESNQKDSMGQIVSIGVKGYKGIEKRFKVYHSQDETKVNVQFKTGYSGLMEGDGQKSRAKYKVEVFSEVNGSESLVYSTEFDPGVNVDDAKKTVVAAVNGKPAKGSLRVTTAAAALEELSQDKYKPLGTGGTFTSKEITLPVGTNSYKVRISSANDRHL
ncbi:YSIRK-type signal peptide-containing protein [Streptococcus sp. 1621]|uniref:YSIRK-type signal peptide-containing protein n=1 Tax=Streptococcus sp. 1621 TaxID=2582676 RepID=UPI001563ABAA|nr:YSIRK-type signal peptide-containing protein [Streptococcus sp. 1621]